jgi:hypothetical protein
MGEFGSTVPRPPFAHNAPDPSGAAPVIAGAIFVMDGCCRERTANT